MPDHPRATPRAWDVPMDRRAALRLGGGLVALGALAACTPAERTDTVTPTATPTATAWAPPAQPMTFPAAFVFGAATSAFQVEGSTTADGRGPSIWDTFAAVPGHIAGGATGDPAADHYRRWEQDLDLMSDLGLRSYRFSVAWPRIQPTGSGPVNQPGVDFYRRLVEGLGERGIAPAITLYHWDLPQPLQDVGGWAVRDTAERFVDYAGIMFDALGDADATWLTINEPKTTASVGYGTPYHAPGVADVQQQVAAVHHQLLGHGLAVRRFRESGALGGIGIALNLLPVYPAGMGAEAPTTRADAVENRLYLDPVLLGTYPDDAIGEKAGQVHADPAAFQALVQAGDLDTISEPLDVLAVQYYGVAGIDRTGNVVTIAPQSDAEWQQVRPEGLYDVLTRLTRDYPDAPPLVVTENGIPDPTAAGTTQDDERTEFLRAHFQQAARAIQDGVDLRAYYVWSLLDNFEWAEGLTQRWGLVHVDFDTQERTPKASALWYRDVIAAGAVPPAG
ncbi:beta-glucosidase [Cellulomonas chitinilytica]|uniref:Beta-glucosidase n=1 Tax=Cellulomonas chitinilytica TaxID=398759 RepID=A0A919NZW1_9CELL|nr:GH1 family beta-glucosidase [Cellulomonas chitinilytica]GIG19650.1 beta-glucosidase [Cellulomonas chitinilytica]